MRRLREGDEKLRSIGILACICHRQQSLLSVLHLEVLVREGSAIDALTSSAVEVCEVTALHHEAFDHSMEDAAFVVQWLAIFARLATLASTKLSEVLRCPWDYVLIELHDYSALRLPTDLNFKEHSGVAG
jgi:hypothetical protein